MNSTSNTLATPAALSFGAVAQRRQRGVTLIELMVGLLIGLLAVLVISQVMLAVEGQKRTTTSGGDAQLTGTLAMYTVQRDLQMAGYGLTASQLGLGCLIKSVNFNSTNGGDTRTMAPIVITNGASGAPDSLRMFTTSKPSFSVPTLITGDHPKVAGAGDNEFAVSNTVGITAGDLMVAVPAAPTATNTCTVFRANGTGSTIGKSVAHAQGAGDANAWNGASNTALLNTFPTGGYPAGSYLVNLGSGLIDRTYSIASGTLRLTEFDSATATMGTASDLFPQVVNLQAYYGKDTNGDDIIDSYDTVTPTTPAGWGQVMAIRIALVVRSDQYETEDITPSAPQWNLGTTPTVTDATKVTCADGVSQCIPLKVDGDINANDWKRYRYKVYDTVIPLRNLLWRS